MSDGVPDLILLKGAPGVGKSTAAGIIANHFRSGVRIEVDRLREMVISVNWTNQAEHRSVLSISARLAADFLRCGFGPVILIDTFSGTKIDEFLSTFHSECPDRRTFVVVLHASDEILRERILNRPADGFRDTVIATRINRESVVDAKPTDLLIDTSTRSPVDVAREVVTAVDDRRSRMTVDSRGRQEAQ